MGFSRTLSPNEAKYKYITLSQDEREEFPEKDKLFDVNFQGKTYQLKVSGKTKDNLMLTPLYETHEFQEGETLIITPIKKGFEFSVE